MARPAENHAGERTPNFVRTPSTRDRNSSADFPANAPSLSRNLFLSCGQLGGSISGACAVRTLRLSVVSDKMERRISDGRRMACESFLRVYSSFATRGHRRHSDKLGTINEQICENAQKSGDKSQRILQGKTRIAATIDKFHTFSEELRLKISISILKGKSPVGSHTADKMSQ